MPQSGVSVAGLAVGSYDLYYVLDLEMFPTVCEDDRSNNIGFVATIQVNP